MNATLSLNVNSPKFDIVEYIKKLRKYNFTQEQAETIAQETEHMIGAVIEYTDRSIKNKELATKNDVR